MPTKILTSPLDRDGVSQKLFKFGGGSNTIIALDDDLNAPGVGYLITSGGGDDTVTGSSYDDSITGGTGSDEIIGGFGDDIINGGEEDGSDGGHGRNPIITNLLYGEQGFVFLSSGETFTGGDDVITAGGGVGVSNFMFGDVRSASGDATTTFIGGDDILIGGMNSTDDMIGDFASTGGDIATTGGLDTFVIGVNGGDDTIWDFNAVEYYDSSLGMDVGDTIELVGFGFSQYSDLDGLWSATTAGFAVLNLDGTVDGLGDTVTFLGVTDPNDLSDSFVFTALV